VQCSCTSMAQCMRHAPLDIFTPSCLDMHGEYILTPLDTGPLFSNPLIEVTVPLVSLFFFGLDLGDPLCMLHPLLY
jgi:hypothetical protein